LSDILVTAVPAAVPPVKNIVEFVAVHTATNFADVACDATALSNTSFWSSLKITVA